MSGGGGDIPATCASLKGRQCVLRWWRVRRFVCIYVSYICTLGVSMARQAVLIGYYGRANRGDRCGNHVQLQPHIIIYGTIGFMWPDDG